MADIHTVYMLQCSDGSLYTGYTNNFANRLHMHEQGKGAKYTRGRGPFKVLLQKTYTTKQAAMQEEYRIKRLQRHEKLTLVKQEQQEENHARTKKF